MAPKFKGIKIIGSKGYLCRETFVVLVLRLDHFSNIVIAVRGFELVSVRVEQRDKVIVIVDA